MNTKDHIEEPQRFLRVLITRKQAERAHRELVKRSQAMLQAFLKLLGEIDYADGKKALTSDITNLFERFCGFDLPENFTQEVGRTINKAVRRGELPFTRGLFGRGSHAGFKGLDLDLIADAIAASQDPSA